LGVVEKVGESGKKAFANYDELWEILDSRKRISRVKKKGGVRERGKRR